MLKLKIISYFTTKALDLLINSNKLEHTVHKLGNSLIIHSDDLEASDKLLHSNSIKYKLINL